jgi:hypothetical protein
MAIKLLDGNILVKDGLIATSDDCCCTPSCIPDPCITPSCFNCYKCWDTTCLQCRNFTSLEITVEGVGDATECPPEFQIRDACYGFDGCKCYVFNSTFIHDFSKGCSSSWLLAESFLGWDTCGTTQNLATGGLQIDKSISVRVYSTPEVITYGVGDYFPFAAPCSGEIILKICTPFTAYPGHFVFVWLKNTVSQFGGAMYEEVKLFGYSFNNSEKVDADCAEDQYYPTCNLTGGEAILFGSVRQDFVFGGAGLINDCDSWEYGCQLKDATVTIGDLVIEACTEEEGP